MIPSMSFSDPVVAGTELVREAIQSPNYVPGDSGWSINADGTAEFRSVTAEGFLLLADGQVTEAKIATGAVTENKLATAAVTGAKIAGSAVDATKLADGSVSALKIVDGAVVESKLGPDSVTQAKIAAAAVDSTEIATGAVVADKIATNAITADKISANAVTAGKIAASAVGATEIAANAIVAGKIAAGAIDTMTLNANTITGATISGTTMTVSGTAAVLQAVDAGGVPVGSINSDGVGSFSSLTVATDDVSIAGKQLSDILAAQSTSILAWGAITTGTDSTTSEKGWFEVAFEAPTSKYYMVTVSGWMRAAAGVWGTLIVKDGGSSQPTLSSTAVLRAGKQFLGTTENDTVNTTMPVYFAAGQHRLLVTFGIYAGSGTLTWDAGTIRPGLLMVSDIPAILPNVAVLNTGGGGSTPPVQTYSTLFDATWSGTYDGSNAFESGEGNNADQGSYDGTSGHNRRGLIGFDSSAITTALSGATILSCTLTMYATHWYYYAGGTAVIGTHNQSSRPATFTGATTNRIQSAGWPNPGARAVDLGVTIGNEFKAGTTKGIAVGPGPSTDATYYGKFAGVGAQGSPFIIITYQK